MVSLWWAGAAGAQTPDSQRLDPLITQAVADVSAARLRASDAQLVAFGTRSTFSEHLGEGRGVFAARDWIAGELRRISAQSGGRLVVALDHYIQHPDGRRIGRDVEVSSVIATLPGDEPGGRSYVISSHYDSRNSNNIDGAGDAPGADDNGSGTAAVLEAARVLAGLRLRATVIFAIYDAEEQGLLGSAHHARALKDAGVDVQGDLNNDIIGASMGDRGERNGDRVRIFSEALAAGADVAGVNALGNENDSPSRELARFARGVGEAYGPGFAGELVFRADRFLRGGDHQSFNAVGFPAIRLVEPIEDFRHQHQDVRMQDGVQFGDLPRFMDFDYLARVTRFDVAVLAALARGPGRPAAAFVATKALSNDTTLRWPAVAGAVGYEVVRRHTTEPDWTGVSAVGTATAVTLPFSKDEYLFGVRAVDARGLRGVAVFPTPQR